jgi:hypothetical protein
MRVADRIASARRPGIVMDESQDLREIAPPWQLTAS